MGCGVGCLRGKSSAEKVYDVSAIPGADDDQILAALEEKLVWPLWAAELCRMPNKEPEQADIPEARRTIIIFDWDEMLFPLNWACEMRFPCGMRMNLLEVRDAHRDILALLTFRLVQLLTTARQLGEVVVLTNELLPWVHPTCHSLMPGVSSTLKKIPVVYNVTHGSKEKNWNRFAKNAQTRFDNKTRAMLSIVAEGSKRSRGRAWTDIVYVGDCRCDLDAIRQAASETCRMKTIETCTDLLPSGLLLQQIVLTRWLSHIVHADFDVDVDFGTGEDMAGHRASKSQ